MNLKALQAEIEDMPSGNVSLPVGDVAALLRLACAVQAERDAAQAMVRGGGFAAWNEAQIEVVVALAALEAL
jgi:hypothetical protein